MAAATTSYSLLLPFCLSILHLLAWWSQISEEHPRSSPHGTVCSAGIPKRERIHWALPGKGWAWNICFLKQLMGQNDSLSIVQASSWVRKLQRNAVEELSPWTHETQKRFIITVVENVIIYAVKEKKTKMKACRIWQSGNLLLVLWKSLLWSKSEIALNC